MCSKIRNWRRKTRFWQRRRCPRFFPPPVRRIIGDLSDRERVLIGLDLLYDELSDTSLSSSLIDAVDEETDTTISSDP